MLLFCQSDGAEERDGEAERFSNTGFYLREVRTGEAVPEFGCVKARASAA